MPFDPAAIASPFRMQPGLRRVAPGTAAVHAAPPGSPEFEAKLAALALHADQCLVGSADVDARPALRAIGNAAGRDCPQALRLVGDCLVSASLGLAVDVKTGELSTTTPANAAIAITSVTTADALAPSSARADESSAIEQPLSARPDAPSVTSTTHAQAHAVLAALGPNQRAAALVSLTLREDFALVDAASASLPWMAVCLPSHWDPREKVGQDFRTVHAPVADSDNVRAAAAHLLALVCGEQRWERFVWTVTTWPGLDQHPERHVKRPWPEAASPPELIDIATFRTERQGFITLPATPEGKGQAVFTIEVQARPLRQALADEGVDPAALSAALASMTDAVLAYRSLGPARDRLCAGLDAIAQQRSASASTDVTAITPNPTTTTAVATTAAGVAPPAGSSQPANVAEPAPHSTSGPETHAASFSTPAP